MVDGQSPAVLVRYARSVFGPLRTLALIRMRDSTLQVIGACAQGLEKGMTAAGHFSSDLADLSALDLRRLIGARAVSPLEVLDACIARIHAVNPAVNALAATDFERARVAARQAGDALMRGDALGPLHGIPVGIKDLQETAGLLTTYGNVRFRDHVPAHDHSMVSRLRKAGAIIAAKTNTPDMGAGANTQNAVWGATGNPFNPTLNAGGSSGGSTVALATGMLPLATGSDLGGSLRIPAAMCGVAGLRPSAGLVADTARSLGWSALSVVGPMARSIADMALLLSAMTGLDAGDPLSYPASARDIWPLEPIDLSTLRIAYTEDLGFCAIDEDIRRVFRHRMAAISSRVHRCEPIDLALGEVDRTFDIARAESFVASFAKTLREAPESLGPNIRANLEIASGISLADRAWAHEEQTRIMRGLQSVYERYDLLVSPVCSISPLPWPTLFATEVGGRTMRNYYEWVAPTYAITLTAHPALSLPCGLDEKGMPFGLQLVGPFRGDARLLAMAHALEQSMADESALARPRPNLSQLTQARPELRQIVTHPPAAHLAAGALT